MTATTWTRRLDTWRGRGPIETDLTFNDYLAQRDAAWMGPVYRFFGLTVGAIQQDMNPAARRTAYRADVTYATAKEAGFDVLRMHLAFVAELREGIHLLGIGGLDPLQEFHKQVAPTFEKLHDAIETQVLETFATIDLTAGGLERAGLRGPASTWTYLVNDRVLNDLQDILFGKGSSSFAAGAVLMAWPLLAVWGAWRWWKQRKDTTD